MNTILETDLKSIYHNLSSTERNKFNNSTLITNGAAGFLGYYTILFHSYGKQLGIKHIFAIDNFKFGNQID